MLGRIIVARPITIYAFPILIVKQRVIIRTRNAFVISGHIKGCIFGAILDIWVGLEFLIGVINYLIKITVEIEIGRFNVGDKFLRAQLA